MRYTFGPVPSRRLGSSLGVNNIPPKFCSYACIYCQLGDPQRVTAEPQPFYNPDDIVEEVISVVNTQGAHIDYVTVVPDGEPTLDSNIAELMKKLQERVETKKAIITNGSLLYRPEVAAAIKDADWVSVKIDAADEKTWRAVDRPSRSLSFTTVLEGIRMFRRQFNGFLATETMLVENVNDSVNHLTALSKIIAEIAPDVAYLSIPTRPPAVPTAVPPGEERILEAYRIFADAGITVELNTGHEVGEFVADDDVAESILAITAVHPIRRDDLKQLLEQRRSPWSVVQELVDAGTLLQKEYRGETFYVKRLKKRRATEHMT